MHLEDLPIFLAGELRPLFVKLRSLFGYSGVHTEIDPYLNPVRLLFRWLPLFCSSGSAVAQPFRFSTKRSNR